MRRVQQDFIDAITFRYDDETRRTMLNIYSRKETLLDADLLEEHLVNQPLLGCIILLLLFLSLVSLVFAIVFVSCRALGNCGAKRYQPHPTSSRRYGFICAIFLISWLFMAISASFFIQSATAFWSPKVPKEFLGDHTLIKRNTSNLQQHMINKRAATSVKPMSIFDLFGDEDYQGDFEQVDPTTSTHPPSFVTASVAPEDRPIPIARTHRKPIKIAKAVVTQRTTSSPLQDSTESDDVPPAVDRLPIRKIDEVETTTLRVMKKFEIPARPQAELEFAKHFDNNVPVIQSPFVSDTWSRAGFSQIGATKNKKLPIQPIAPPVVLLNENDVEKIEEEEEKNQPSTTNKPLEVTTEKSTTTTTASTTTSTTTSPLMNDIVHDSHVVAVESSEMETEDAATVPTNESSTSTTPETTTTTTTTTSTTTTASTAQPPEEVDDDVILSSSSDVILNEGNVETEPEVVTESDMPTPEPIFDANVEESKEDMNSSGKESDVMATESTTTSTSSVTTEVSSTEIVPQPTTPEVIQFAISEEPEVPKENTNDEGDLVLSAVVASEAPKQSTTEAVTEATTEARTTTSEETTSAVASSSPTEETSSAATEEATQTESEEYTTEDDDEHSPSTSVVTLPQGTSSTTEEITEVTMTTTEGVITHSTTETTTTVTETTVPVKEVTVEEEESIQFVPITKETKEEEWIPVTETTRPQTTVGVFPSVPLTPDNSHGKIEQLATPLLYPYRLLHTSGVVWLSRLSLLFLGGVMVVVSLPSMVLVLLGTIYYKSTQHPIDRKKTSDQIGQLVVIIATFLLFTLPLMFIFVQVSLTYNHLHNSVCPLIQLKYQQDLGILGQVNSLTPESREIFMRNRVNRDNCEASQAPLETMWLSCLCFCLSSIPVLITLFKLSKYYLRMKTEYYWKLSDYGTIYAKRPAVDTAQSIYGNIYGTVGPRRPTSRPPPAPVSPDAAQNYADGPIYSEGPIYGVYQAYGRF